MKGDFSRGHRPDQKRSKLYRRVLLQEGRLVTDSDVAAGVDAFDTLVRNVAADLGCETGSPDMGYVVTPGPLYVLFDTLERVTLPPPASLFKAHRDHAKKYLERYPSLYIDGSADDGFVRVGCRQDIDTGKFPKLHVWAILPAGVKLSVRAGGSTFSTPAGSGSGKIEPYLVDLTPLGAQTLDSLELGFPAPGAEAWVAMIEGAQAAGTKPTFWSTSGQYYAQGLEVQLTPDHSDAAYPEVTFPPALGFAAPSPGIANAEKFVAYLEAWERLVTRVEDKGILEQALGGLDTTVRTQALGQVKIARWSPAGGADGDKVYSAFAEIDRGKAELTVTTAPKVDDPDPCALPVEGGYTGPDNRLYRFEVHVGGNLGAAVVKWSKNNGSDLFDVTLANAGSGEINVLGTNDVTDGDLVELLDETVDLGDSADATITVAGPHLRPAERRVGTLYYARSTAVTGQIQLLDLVTKNPVALGAAFFTAARVPKIRRWHGVMSTTAAPTNTFDLGDGISVTLSGSDYRAGDYWQFEARRLKDNANGDWQKSPHGPERIFAPLALFEYKGQNAPLLLLRWYDHQYSAICELDADDIAYDGDKVGTEADTVQEAIDELYSKIQGGCCDVHLSPSKTDTDDAARIQDAIDNKLPPQGGTICLKTGVYHFKSTVNVLGKRVAIVGCPTATCVRDPVSSGPMFEVGSGAHLTLCHLISWAREGSKPVIMLPDLGGGLGTDAHLTLAETAVVALDTNGMGVWAASADPSVPSAEDPKEWKPLGDGDEVSMLPEIQIRDSIVVGAWAVAARYARQSAVIRSLLVGGRGALHCLAADGLRLQGSRLRTSFEAVRSELLSVDMASAESGLSAALDDIGSAAIEKGSCALIVAVWQSGEASNCLFEGGAAVRAGEVTDVSLHENLWSGVDGIAFRADRVVRSRLCGDTLSAEAVGLYVPWRVSACQVVRASITAQRGVVFGATTELYPLPDKGVSVADVRVEGCTITAAADEEVAWQRLVGIAVGPLPVDADGDGIVDPVFATVRALDLSGNTIQGAAVGILFTLLMQGSSPTRDVRLSNNRLRKVGVYGIYLQGAGNQISGNFIDPKPLLGSWVGVLLLDASSTVARRNSVLAAGGSGKHFGIVGYSTLGTVSDLLIDANAITAVEAGGVHLPIWFDSSLRASFENLTISANRCEGTMSYVRYAKAIHVTNNQFHQGKSETGGGLTIEDSLGGHVSGNWFEADGLEIVGASEKYWQIEDNVSAGRILIQPERIYVNPAGGGFAKFFAPGGISLQKATDTFEEMLLLALDSQTDQEKTLADAIKGNMFFQGGDKGEDAAEGGAGKAAKKAAKPVTPPMLLGALFGDPKAGADGFADGGVKDPALDAIGVLLGSLLADIDSAIALPYYQEYPFHVLVNGNFAGADLVVGHPSSDVKTAMTEYSYALPDPTSIVQITSNRAKGWMITSSLYQNLVATGNAASEYAGLSSVGAYNIHNLDF